MKLCFVFLPQLQQFAAKVVKIPEAHELQAIISWVIQVFKLALATNPHNSQLPSHLPP